MFQFIINYVKSMFTGSAKMPSYTVITVSPGHYDIAVVLPAIGTQHYDLKFDVQNNTFSLTGKVAIIGEDAGMPISFFSQMINDAFSKFVSDNVIRMKLKDQLRNMKLKYEINNK